MQILVDCSNYFFDNNNHGDRAIYKMLEMRLRHFWPQAKISWITLDPGLMQKTLPNVSPFTLAQRHHWQLFTLPQKQKAPGLLGLISPWWGRSFPTKAQQVLIETVPDVSAFVEKFRESDLILALGGGAFSDYFPEHACGLLDTLEGGLVFEKPVALLSVGFESIRNQLLIEKCQRVLPRLHLVACREPNIGPPMLSDFGVINERVVVTGDEAIELAYCLRSEQAGHAIGVNLRQSVYSEIDDGPIETIRSVLHQFARQYNAALLGAPISMFGPSDVESIQKIISGYDGFVDNGETLNTPEDVIHQIGKCRIVVTGSYHSAVFALAQGIPVVAIARSLHYRSKLTGLAAQFGAGCVVIDTAQENFAESLQKAVDEAWKNADNFKQPLLEMAQLQINESWKAIQQLFEIVQHNKKH